MPLSKARVLAEELTEALEKFDVHVAERKEKERLESLETEE